METGFRDVLVPPLEPSPPIGHAFALQPSYATQQAPKMMVDEYVVDLQILPQMTLLTIHSALSMMMTTRARKRKWVIKSL